MLTLPKLTCTDHLRPPSTRASRPFHIVENARGAPCGGLAGRIFQNVVAEQTHGKNRSTREAGEVRSFNETHNEIRTRGWAQETATANRILARMSITVGGHSNISYAPITCGPSLRPMCTHFCANRAVRQAGNSDVPQTMCNKEGEIFVLPRKAPDTGLPGGGLAEPRSVIYTFILH